MVVGDDGGGDAQNSPQQPERSKRCQELSKTVPSRAYVAGSPLQKAATETETVRQLGDSVFLITCKAPPRFRHTVGIASDCKDECQQCEKIVRCHRQLMRNVCLTGKHALRGTAGC